MRTSNHKSIRLFAVIGLSSLIMGTSFAQSTGDAAESTFQDELLNNFVGKWEANATVHKTKFTLNFKVDWVLNHQYLRVYFISNEIIPWLKVPFESELYLGFDKVKQQYTFHELTVHGDTGPFEERLSSAQKTGNGFKLIKKRADVDMTIIQQFVWDPTSKTWQISSMLLTDGKEEEPFLEMKLVPENS